MLALLCGSLFGQEITAVDVSGLSDGQYVLTVEGGNVAVVPLTLITPGNNPTPTPKPNPQPQPDMLTARAKAIQSAAAQVTGDPKRTETADSLAYMYSAIADQITSGTISDYKSAEMAATMAGNLTLAGVSKQWQPVRDVFNAQWVKLTQEGGELADYAKLLQEASSGLAATVDVQEIDPARLAKLMEWIKIIMELLKAFNITSEPMELEPNG